MKTAAIGLFSALLLPIARAAPLEKREIVWITVTSDVIETVDVTSTVFVDAADVTAAAAAETQVVVTVTATATAEQDTPAAPETTSTTDAPVQAAVAAPSSPSAASSTSSSSSTLAPEPAPAVSTSSSVAEELVYTPASSPSITTSTQAPDPTTSEEPTTTTAAAAAATSSASSGSASSGGSGSCDAGDPTSGSPCTGDITYYTPGLGACGTTSTESDLIVALDVDFMGSASNSNPYCGKSITLSYGGVTATGTVVDKCMGCPSKTSIDLSPAFFEKFGSLDAGKISDVEWWFD